MRFILSALFAAALMGTMATANVHQGQQAPFRLEPRHNHQRHNQVDHSHHHKSSSKKQRRDLQKDTFVPAVPAANVAVFGSNARFETANGANAEAEKTATNLGLHSKKTRQHHKKANNSHHKKTKRTLELHRKNANHSHHKKSSSCQKHVKRDVEGLDLHSKKARSKNHKSNANHSHNKKIQRRAVAAKNIADSELAFHRKISRNRKTKILGRNKKNKRELFRTQDIKNEKSVSKQHKASRKGKKAHRD